MLNTLFHILVPNIVIPEGAAPPTVEAEGMSWGWALFILVFLVVALAWSYRKFAPAVPVWKRLSLTVLRGILFALILVFLVHPVLHFTVEESVRRPLLVLLDTTQSMQIHDQRNRPEDLARAALAKGLIGPTDGVKKALPLEGDKLKEISRQQLLESLAANTRLNLWTRLFDKADLVFYGFGRKTRRLSEFIQTPGESFTTENAAAFFHAQHYDENLTALGDSLKDILNEQRGQSLAGILVITDGANNTGSPVLEAANLAKQDGVPLFLYGVGVTNTPDIMVVGLSSPQVINVKEKTAMTVRIRSQSMVGKKATIQLKLDGKVVDQQPLEFRAEGEQDLTLNFTPDKTGEHTMEAFVPPLPEEFVKDNNSASLKVRVVDDKINILLIKEEPDWDFEYLLSMLQRDRRVKLKCVVIKGDPDLSSQPDSIFLDKIPEDKEALTNNDIVILSDVNPSELGTTRMTVLNDWVSKTGGGLIFVAGPQYCPNGYIQTPLEPLLPVEINSKSASRYEEPVKLDLTLLGESSPMLFLSENPEQNIAQWKKFAGVFWTAWVGRAHPGSQVLMTDPTPERVTRDGAMPVMVQQNYGLGMSLYIGFNETYRWRSHEGEKYYTRIWGQLIQTLSSARKQGASALTQLRLDKTQYVVGDRIRIAGRIFKPGFEPLTDPEVPATLVITPPEGERTAQPAQTIHVSLQALPDFPGEYRCEIPATHAGNYHFTTVRDPESPLKFDVTVPRVELADIAMNEKLLKAMANTSGGRFLREEDLDSLPQLLAEKSSDNVSFKKIPLAFSPIFFFTAILVACIEWFWRRKLELK